MAPQNIHLFSGAYSACVSQAKEAEYVIYIEAHEPGQRHNELCQGLEIDISDFFQSSLFHEYNLEP